jgi:hypothetical protein
MKVRKVALRGVPVPFGMLGAPASNATGAVRVGPTTAVASYAGNPMIEKPRTDTTTNDSLRDATMRLPVPPIRMYPSTLVAVGRAGNRKHCDDVARVRAGTARKHVDQSICERNMRKALGPFD